MEEPEITQNTSNSDGTWISQLGSPGWSDIWAQTEKQAKVKGNPVARAVLILRQKIDGSLKEIEGKSKEFESELKSYQGSLRRTEAILMGIVFITLIAFITTLSLTFFDLIKEKDLHLQYSKLYQEYSERNSELKDVIREQEIDLNDFQKELELLRAKNSYLK